jgi:crotonobetainyl-CoA:carnitine CoA-transferase CaiB-like acyl-CoA transferase
VTDRRGRLRAAAAQQPKLIYCSITAPAGEPPHSFRYDLLVQALGGLMSITGEPDGPPQAGRSRGDVLAGLSHRQLAALRHRDAGRGTAHRGQLAVGAARRAVNQGPGIRSQALPGRMGNEHPSIAPVCLFTADGELVVAAATAPFV